MKDINYLSTKYNSLLHKTKKKFVSNKEDSTLNTVLEYGKMEHYKLKKLDAKLQLGKTRYYENFDINKYGNTLQPGSIPADGTYEKWIQTSKPSVVIEVGSFLGYSAIKMAKEVQRLNLNTKIICVDTWLGSPEHYDHSDTRLNYINGYPSMYYNFISNVIAENVHNVIYPFPFPSSVAFKILKKIFSELEISADFIFIDGSHEEEDVYTDLFYYYQLLSKDAEIWGDDWDWESVKKSVIKFSNDIGNKYTVDKNNIHWFIKKQ